jgi:hypothetical protein
VIANRARVASPASTLLQLEYPQVPVNRLSVSLFYDTKRIVSMRQRRNLVENLLTATAAAVKNTKRIVSYSADLTGGTTELKI